MTEAPNPGSDDAIKEGCICPVLDNAHGWGYHQKGVFVMTVGCPVHGTPEWMKKEPTTDD